MNVYQILASAIDFKLGKSFAGKDIAKLNRSIDSHENLAEMAESHGVAPLFYDFIIRQKLVLPLQIHRQFQSLSLRHKHAALAREQIIILIIDRFKHNNIDLILLKGIALAYSVYCEPKFRPMRDIDLLIPQDKLMIAKSVLVEMGFVFDDTHPSVYMEGMHHLPNAVKSQNGFTISLELHHQVYSRDMSVRQTYQQAKNTVRPIMINNQCLAQTLGHVSMLNHLCHHAFGPGDEVRLIHQFEILRYASQFVNEIPWKDLNAESPFVINTIRCLHFSLTLPASINEIVEPPLTKKPGGIGQSLPIYSKVLQSNQLFLKHIKKILFPSGWWMHVNYNVPPEKSLFWCYVFIHPKRVLGDLLVRLASMIQLKHRQRSDEYR